MGGWTGDAVAGDGSRSARVFGIRQKIGVSRACVGVDGVRLNAFFPRRCQIAHCLRLQHLQRFLHHLLADFRLDVHGATAVGAVAALAVGLDGGEIAAIAIGLAEQEGVLYGRARLEVELQFDEGLAG